MVIIANNNAKFDAQADVGLEEEFEQDNHPHRDIVEKAEYMLTDLSSKSAANILVWIISSFVLVFIIWASVTTLDRTIHAAGRVIPSSRLQVILELEGGIVQEILVHAGQMVRRNQVLVKLDRSQSVAELGSNETTVAALHARVARLTAEVGGIEPRYGVPRSDEEREQISMEMALHSARLADLATMSSAADARVMQAERAIVEADAGFRSRVSARNAAAEQVALIAPLVERGIEPRVSLIQLRSTAAIAASDAEQAAASISRARAALSEARAAKNQIRDQWRSQAAADLSAAGAEMTTRGAATPALAARLKRFTVVAPVDGRINRVLVNTIGSAVGAGQPIVEVVPSSDKLTVEASVSPKDIASVHVGQKAQINVSAYDSAVFGSMSGQVISVSPDSIVDERSGESHFTVRVRADVGTLKDKNGRDLPIGAGMTADVNLLGEKRSIMSYIFTPLTRIRDNALRE